ncbi:MAG: iron-containing alcohol dehydrogenase [Clostridia bacterium]|nr:iron-containing alcohol dehydrogenase [Clostridia bacterium]
MNKYYAKTFQLVMKVAMGALPWKTPKVISGDNVFERLALTIKKNDEKHPFIVTGPNIFKRGMLDELLKVLDERGLNYTVFKDVSANPTDTEAMAGLTEYLDSGSDCFILFGGGSPMDLGKAVAALSVNQGKSVRNLQGLLKVRHKVPTIYAVPTTSGTGSETTIAAVITESATHHKASISDPKLMPSYAVLYPELTRGLPPKVTAQTGMDALCHAVESFTNAKYNTKLEDEYAVKAVKLIHDNILAAFEDGDNLDARECMQFAAFYAGRSFTRGCVGYVHAIGHTLSGLYGLDHGLAMAVILPKVLRKYGKDAEGKLAVLADACGMQGKSISQLAESFISWIEDTNEKMGIPTTFPEIKDEDIPQMVAWAMKEGNPVYPTPQLWNEKDFEELIHMLK